MAIWTTAYWVNYGPLHFLWFSDIALPCLVFWICFRLGYDRRVWPLQIALFWLAILVVWMIAPAESSINLLFLQRVFCFSVIPFLLLYRNNLKNRLLAASAFPQQTGLHSRLAYRQWSLAPDKFAPEPPCQIPDSSGYFGIEAAAVAALVWGAHRFFLKFANRQRS